MKGKHTRLLKNYFGKLLWRCDLVTMEWQFRYTYSARRAKTRIQEELNILIEKRYCYFGVQYCAKAENCKEETKINSLFRGETALNSCIQHEYIIPYLSGKRLNFGAFSSFNKPSISVTDIWMGLYLFERKIQMR